MKPLLLTAALTVVILSQCKSTDEIYIDSSRLAAIPVEDDDGCTFRGIEITGSLFYEGECDDEAFLGIPSIFVVEDEVGPYLEVVTRTKKGESTRYKLRLQEDQQEPEVPE